MLEEVSGCRSQEGREGKAQYMKHNTLAPWAHLTAQETR